MHIVTVLFTIHAAHWQAFKEAMHANAATSLATESGCRQFDVCEGLPGTYTIFLYEVYDAEADFKVHLNADHFLSFNAISAPWVIDKQVQVFSRTSAV